MRPFGRDVSGHGGLDAANGRFGVERSLEEAAAETSTTNGCDPTIQNHFALIAIADHATSKLDDSYGHQAAADSMATVRNVPIAVVHLLVAWSRRRSARHAN